MTTTADIRPYRIDVPDVEIARIVGSMTRESHPPV